MTVLWCLAGFPNENGGGGCRGFSAGEPEQATRTPLCDTCLDAAPRDIEALPLDYRDLEQLLPPALGVWGDGTPHGTDQRAPIRLGVEALQRQIWAVLVTWEQVVRDSDRLSDIALLGVRDGFAVSRAVRVLSPRVQLLATIGPVTVQDYPLIDVETATVYHGHVYEQVSGARGILDLVRTHAKARSVLGLTAPVRRLPGVCDKCSRPDLRQDQPREAGDEQPVYCGSCRLTMTYSDWEKRHNVLRRRAA